DQLITCATPPDDARFQQASRRNGFGETVDDLGAELAQAFDGTVMASTATLQTARAPLGVSGLLDAAAGEGLFCSVMFMIIRFWLLAPLETKKALSLARRRFLLFQRFGLPVLFACRGASALAPSTASPACRFRRRQPPQRW